MPSITSASSNATQLYGLASGLDWSNIVNKLVQIEQAPEALLNSQNAKASNQSSAFDAIGTKLTTLSADLKTLKDPNFFSSRSASSSDSTVATAKADTGTSLGNYAFNITKLATAAVLQGTVSTSKPLSPTNDVSGLVLANAGFATAVTAGTFTVNGQIVTIATSDTLQGVFDKISTATGGTVSGAYNASTDEISLTGSSPIVLGSANDSSNFISATNLYNNGTSTVTSTSKLGGINQNAPLANANFATTITDGGSHAGSFLVNGVAIAYDASKDAVNDVIQKVNNSSAGVTASYDALNNRFQFTNKAEGDVGISYSDVTGNFLAAIGISAGTLQRGSNLQYSINGGATLTSRSNTIDSTSSNLKGLSLNVLQTGRVNINVGTDTSKISSTISTFVSDYNDIQSFISSQTKTSTDSAGKVSAGTFTGNQDVENLSATLRKLIDATPFSGAISNLGSLGIISNGNDNKLAIADSTVLDNAITNNLEKIKTLFSDTSSGIAATLDTFITKFNGSDGTIETNKTTLKKRITDNNATIARLELKIAADRDRITASFVAYETVANNTASQKQFLTSTFTTSTSNG